MANNQPIGIFDSGVGGLTVVDSLIRQLPEESFIYFGDTAHLPYGEKTAEQLFMYADRIIKFLIERGVKAIIVACGTHSSVTLPYIAGNFDIPIMGVLKPGARCAANTTRCGVIGIAATLATVKSKAYTRELSLINPSYKIYETACVKFVPLIEAGQLDTEEMNDAVYEYIDPLMRKGIDTLVLGCTHYPFIASAIKRIGNENLKLVDPSFETVNALQQILIMRDMLNDGSSLPERQFFVSGNDDSFYNVGKLLIGNIIEKVDRVDMGDG